MAIHLPLANLHTVKMLFFLFCRLESTRTWSQQIQFSVRGHFLLQNGTCRFIFVTVPGRDGAALLSLFYKDANPLWLIPISRALWLIIFPMILLLNPVRFQHMKVNEIFLSQKVQDCCGKAEQMALLYLWSYQFLFPSHIPKIYSIFLFLYFPSS